MRVRDGIQDLVRCGDGSDAVDADTLDEIAADCENVTRTPTPAPPGSGGARDRTAPRVEVGAASRQRIRRSRRIRLFASTTERGYLAASGTLRIAGLALPLRVVRKRIAVAGAGTELAVTLSQLHWRQALRALRRRGRVSVRLTVVATDAAGNSRQARPVTIRLLR